VCYRQNSAFPKLLTDGGLDQRVCPKNKVKHLFSVPFFGLQTENKQCKTNIYQKHALLRDAISNYTGTAKKLLPK